MRGRIIRIADLKPGEEAAWRDLARRSVEPNPFFEPDFVVPAARHLDGGENASLVVAEEAGCFHACLPVVGGRLFARRYSPVTRSWLHLYGFLGTPLVAADRGVEAVGALLSATMRGTAWPRVLVLELFGDDGPVASYLRGAAARLGLSVHVRSCGERAVFHCQNGEADLDTPGAKRERRAKARQWRRLRDDWGEPSVVDRAGQRDAWEAFLAIESSGWKGRAGTALASRAPDAAFYREVTARFHDAGRLHLYALEANGNTLAMQTNLCAGDALFDWKAAYDEQFASYSPGAQLQLRVLELARQSGMSWIDSCSDVADEHQLRLSAMRRRVATVLVVPDGRLPLAALALRARLMKATHKLLGRGTP